jgi:hypothetical protein
MIKKISVSLLVGVVIALGTATSISAYAQQQTNFAAILTGKGLTPPVNTGAKGVATFHINPNGGLCYYVGVSGISGVLGAHIGFKNGTELAGLTNPYANIDTQQAYPTGAVNGTLTVGEIKSGINTRPGAGGVVSPNSLHGPLIGKNVTDLTNIVKSKNAYVTVRTVDHQRGEIQGQILPSKLNISCLSSMRFAPPVTSPSLNNSLY